MTAITPLTSHYLTRDCSSVLCCLFHWRIIERRSGYVRGRGLRSKVSGFPVSSTVNWSTIMVAN